MSINKLEECLTTHEIEFLKKIDEYDNIKEGFNLVALLDQIPKDIPAHEHPAPGIRARSGTNQDFLSSAATPL